MSVGFSTVTVLRGTWIQRDFSSRCLRTLGHVVLRPRTTCSLHDKPSVVIVGAGLAGLAAAKTLGEEGYYTRLIEASDGVGGRVRSDRADGFILDRGFHVFVEAYPEQKRMLDYDRLKLCRFVPGALVHLENAFHAVADPFRKPLYAIQGLFSPVGSLVDKIRVLGLRNKILSIPYEDLLGSLGGETTESFLKKSGFSDQMIDSFFRPFYRGIFLSSLQEQSANLFAYVFRMFSTEPASLPSEGIGQISSQLAESLPSSVSVECGKKVTSLSEGKLTVLSEDTGAEENVSASAIIVAAEGPAAFKLLSEAITLKSSRSSVCLYFVSDRKPPISKPILVLNGVGDDDGPVNNMFIPSVVAPSYAPPGKTLISTSIVGDMDSVSDNALERDVRAQMEKWFGPAEVEAWRLLKVYRIKHAQPAQDPDFVLRRTVDVGSGTFVCGDHRNTPTVNGALSSGKEAAKKAIEFLKSQGEK